MSLVLSPSRFLLMIDEAPSRYQSCVPKYLYPQSLPARATQ